MVYAFHLTEYAKELLNMTNDYDIVFSKFLRAFRAGCVPHIPFFNSEAFCLRLLFKIFAPLISVFKRSFINVAVKLAA